MYPCQRGTSALDPRLAYKIAYIRTKRSGGDDSNEADEPSNCIHASTHELRVRQVWKGEGSLHHMESVEVEESGGVSVGGCCSLSL